MHNVAKPLAMAIMALALTAARPDTFTREQLEALEAEKKAAEISLAALESAGQETVTDINDIDNQLLAAAMEARRREEQAVEAEKSLIDLSARRQIARARILEDEQAFEDLIAALAASNRRRPPALIVSPGKANMAVRRAILMSETTPRLAARSEALRLQIDDLNQLERHIRGEQATLAAAEATLELKQVEIERLAASKRGSLEDLTGDIAAIRARAQILSAEAATLRDLLSALESAAPSAPGAKPAGLSQSATKVALKNPGRSSPTKTVVTAKPLGKAALGSMLAPTSGGVLYDFGDKLPTGGKAEWVSFETRSEAQIVAPVAGKVEYARPFRSYGTMLILRTSDDYHVILMGMSRIYVTEGQTVIAGEPVGRMPDRSDPPPELKLELRLGDKVMNPAQWLSRGK